MYRLKVTSTENNSSGNGLKTPACTLRTICYYTWQCVNMYNSLPERSTPGHIVWLRLSTLERFHLMTSTNKPFTLLRCCVHTITNIRESIKVTDQIFCIPYQHVILETRKYECNGPFMRSSMYGNYPHSLDLERMRVRRFMKTEH